MVTTPITTDSKGCSGWTIRQNISPPITNRTSSVNFCSVVIFTPCVCDVLLIIAYERSKPSYLVAKLWLVLTGSSKGSADYSDFPRLAIFNIKATGSKIHTVMNTTFMVVSMASSPVIPSKSAVLMNHRHAAQCSRTSNSDSSDFVG